MEKFEKDIQVILPQVVFCYAHKDERLVAKLKTHLIALQRQKQIRIWHDRMIDAGAEWEREIKKHFDTANIILFLVSPDFMASDYCYGVEVEHAMQRHERGDVLVIPVILRPVYFQGAPFGKLQALPKDAQPITGSAWRSQDQAFYNVAEGIRKIAEQLQPIIAQKTMCILLVRGDNPSNNPIYAYVAVRGDMLESFMAAQKNGEFYPQDFGMIIEAGEGEPPQEVRKKMEDVYGFNH